MEFSWNSFVSKVKETTDQAGDLLKEAATQAAPHLEKFSGDVKSLAGKAAVAAKDLAERVEREVRLIPLELSSTLHLVPRLVPSHSSSSLPIARVAGGGWPCHVRFARHVLRHSARCRDGVS